MDRAMFHGMTQPPNITQLQHKLRKGSEPCDLGLAKLGEGVQKVAYLYVNRWGARYAVKEGTGGFRRPEMQRPPDLRKYGCDTIYQFRAGKWIIQECVTVLWNTRERDNPSAWKAFYAIQNNERGDYHAKNFGIRADGSLVCFDW